MLAIIKITFREALGRKVVLISLLLAAAFLGLYGTGVHFVAKDLTRDPNPMLEQMIYPQLLSFGLYFGGFIISFLSIFSAAGAIASEIDSGIIQTIVPKPVRRYEIVVGKFLGIGLFLALYAAAFFIVISMLIHLKTGLELTGQWHALALFALQPRGAAGGDTVRIHGVVYHGQRGDNVYAVRDSDNRWCGGANRLAD